MLNNPIVVMGLVFVLRRRRGRRPGVRLMRDKGSRRRPTGSSSWSARAAARSRRPNCCSANDVRGKDKKTLFESLTPEFLTLQNCSSRPTATSSPSTLFGIALVLGAVGATFSYMVMSAKGLPVAACTSGSSPACSVSPCRSCGC